MIGRDDRNAQGAALSSSEDPSGGDITQAMEWLKGSQGLQDLADDELNAIRDFGLLWGLFEGVAMATRGSQQEIGRDG